MIRGKWHIRRIFRWSMATCSSCVTASLFATRRRAWTAPKRAFQIWRSPVSSSSESFRRPAKANKSWTKNLKRAEARRVLSAAVQLAPRTRPNWTQYQTKTATNKNGNRRSFSKRGHRTSWMTPRSEYYRIVEKLLLQNTASEQKFVDCIFLAHVVRYDQVNVNFEPAIDDL